MQNEIKPWEVLKKNLTDHDFKFEEITVKDTRILQIHFGSLPCQFNQLTVYITDKDDFALCHTTIPMNVKSKRRAAVSEYLHRCNYALNFGNFEFDVNDGEVRYKSILSYNDLLADNEEAMKTSVLIGLSMFIKYGDGLLLVMMGMKTPEEANELAENNALCHDDDDNDNDDDDNDQDEDDDDDEEDNDNEDEDDDDDEDDDKDDDDFNFDMTDDALK